MYNLSTRVNLDPKPQRVHALSLSLQRSSLELSDTRVLLQGLQPRNPKPQRVREVIASVL